MRAILLSFALLGLSGVAHAQSTDRGGRTGGGDSSEETPTRGGGGSAGSVPGAPFRATLAS